MTIGLEPYDGPRLCPEHGQPAVWLLCERDRGTPWCSRCAAEAWAALQAVRKPPAVEVALDTPQVA